MRGLILVVLALGLAVPAVAAPPYLPGETCETKRKLRVSVKGKKRKATVKKGENLEITIPGRRFTEVKAGDVTGLVANKRLKRACRIPRDRCTVQAPLKVRGTFKLEGKAFLVKKGTRITVMRYAHDRVDLSAGDTTGRIKPEDLVTSCPKLAEKIPAPPEPEPEPEPAAPDEPELSGLLVMAFAVADKGSPSRAAGYFAELRQEVTTARSDAATGGHPAGVVSEPRGLKEHLQTSRDQAREARARWLLSGRLTTDKGDKLTLALVDVETGKVLKGINARPTGRAGDPWAKKAATLVLEPLPAATGEAPVAPEPEPATAPPSTTEPAVAADDAAEVARADAEGAPWFANGLAYTALGTGAVLAGSGAVVGTLALLDRMAFDTTPAVQDERRALGQRAAGQAIAADALYGSAAVFGAAALLFFVTGVDYASFVPEPSDPRRIEVGG